MLISFNKIKFLIWTTYFSCFEFWSDFSVWDQNMIHYMRKTKWDVETKGVGPLQAYLHNPLSNFPLTTGRSADLWWLTTRSSRRASCFLMVAETLLCSPWNCRHPWLGHSAGFREPLGCLTWRRGNQISFFHFLSLSKRKYVISILFTQADFLQGYLMLCINFHSCLRFMCPTQQSKLGPGLSA